MASRWIVSSALAFVLWFPISASAFQATAEKSDSKTAEMVEKVIEIGKTDNRVQEHLHYLTNRIGPRLTGSEGLQAACEWARDEFEEMGLEARLEQWGDFPVGFERGPSSGVMVSPKKMILEFGTNAWTAGTTGRDLGKTVIAPKSMEQLEEMRDSIKGAYVLAERASRRPRRSSKTPPAQPAGDKTSDQAKQETPKPLTREQQEELQDAILACKPAGIIRSTSDELIRTGGRYQIEYDNLPTVPYINLLKEQFDEIKSLVDKGEDVQLAFDIRNHFRKGPIPLYNVIADIPGTEWPDQYVIVGGHIDSWDGATGTTDNGTGVSTTMEAARLLMAAGVKPRRTIRFMLWSGEEQGLLGSRAYVKKHRQDVNEKVSAVFVHDGGTNYCAGLTCTEAMKPDFEKVFAPAMTLDERTPFTIETSKTLRSGGGSDHASFVAAGVPGFFWRQAGRASYRTTWHTQFDTFDSAVPEYQQHSSIVIALGALGTANLDHLLPRGGMPGQSPTSKKIPAKMNSKKAPVAKTLPAKLTTHGIERVDNYYWLNDRENPEVIDYLNKENDYTNAMLADIKPLEENLFTEIKGRIKQDDSSVPYADRGYVYYTRFEKGEQYPIYCRKLDQKDAAEEVMLNVNELAKGHSFCNVSRMRISPDNKLAAFAVDFTGRRKYNLRFKDLTTGELLDDQVDNVTGGCVWANDSKTVFFTRKDPQTLRAYLIVRHELGTSADQDVNVYEETDEEFSCSVSQSRSREFIFIGSQQTLSTEYRYLSADDPHGEFTVFSPRQENHEYSIDHLGDTFYIRSNNNAKNFRLLTADAANHAQSQWKEVIPHRDDVLLQGFTLFDDYLVLSERKEGLVQLRIKSNDGSQDFYMPFDEPAYVASAAATPDPGTKQLRYVYTSLTTPNSVLEFNMDTREKKLLKQEEVLGDFDSNDYRTERVWATARDGVKVPVSIVYHKNTKIDGSAPCLEYGYGSYGASMDPRFNSALLSLLDRGFVYAIAHIRGGQEMGRQWYENGKLLNKMNTFNDFIDVGKFLVEKKYANPKQLYCRGGSAGGLLIGAVINLEPELYHGAIADVPFVDVVTTMLDDTIPLTTFEYDEWGNPNEKEYFEYMLSYSPYDQVSSANYPNLLVTTGLHDSQVQYWEPAKWVAKMRAKKQGDNLLLLKTNMDAGHGGASGRFDRFKLVATRYAFLLKLAGIEK